MFESRNLVFHPPPSKFVAGIPFVRHNLCNLRSSQVPCRPQRTRDSTNGAFAAVLKIAHGMAQSLFCNSRPSMRTAGRQFDLISRDFGSKAIKQETRLKILITLHRQNLPPVQSDAVQKSMPSPLQYLIHPAIPFGLTRKLMNAQNPCSQPPAPLLVGVCARETQIDNQIPALL